MCGIDSADGQTECGMKLCCSYYGWCGTEEVHCKNSEPQVGVYCALARRDTDAYGYPATSRVKARPIFQG